MEVKVRTMDDFRVKIMLEWRSRLYGMEFSKKNLIAPFLYGVNLGYLFGVQPCAES
jgi:hypothetical protein